MSSDDEPDTPDYSDNKHVDELTDKLELFILDENLRREIGEKNRAIAQKSFHIRNLDLALKRLLID